MQHPPYPASEMANDLLPALLIALASIWTRRAGLDNEARSLEAAVVLVFLFQWWYISLPSVEVQ